MYALLFEMILLQMILNMKTCLVFITKVYIWEICIKISAFHFHFHRSRNISKQNTNFLCLRMKRVRDLSFSPLTFDSKQKIFVLRLNWECMRLRADETISLGCSSIPKHYTHNRKILEMFTRKARWEKKGQKKWNELKPNSVKWMQQHTEIKWFDFIEMDQYIKTDCKIYQWMKTHIYNMYAVILKFDEWIEANEWEHTWIVCQWKMSRAKCSQWSKVFLERGSHIHFVTKISKNV